MMHALYNMNMLTWMKMENKEPGRHVQKCEKFDIDVVHEKLWRWGVTLLGHDLECVDHQ